MTIAELDATASAVRLTWADGEQTVFPYLWLRDSSPDGFHPETGERTFDLLSVPEDITPKTVTVEGDSLLVEWPGDGIVSRFPLDWLSDHRPGQMLADPAALVAQSWHHGMSRNDLPVAEAETLLTDDSALLDWAVAAKRTGLALVTGLEGTESGLAVAERIGFLRETNFGRVFEVISKPDPNNLAYTALALPLHTDLTNQEMPPGYQFLHCIANSAEGGGSVFADGYAIAEALAKRDAEAFRQLTTVAIPMRFHDRDTDLRRHDRVIRLDDDGRPVEIRYNAHLAGIFDMPADKMAPYYRAYRAFMSATRDPANHLTLRLCPGEMAVFDNRRILHGREAFDPATGSRHLRGCYVDRGEWDRRIRVLSRNGGG
jgi:gamma-butyrobetaine dioxygenase